MLFYTTFARRTLRNTVSAPALKSHEARFHVNGNRKSLEGHCFSYQVSTHLPYLSKTTINLRENLVKLSFSQYH